MTQDISKHLERARRSLEKNKLREAVAEYQAVLDEAPSNQEALQALADLYTRLNEPEQAANYYGVQFDRLIDSGDLSKASAIFQRFMRSYAQPPDRLMRYAMLLQKHNRTGDSIEQYSAAAGLFLDQHREIEALASYESIAILDPENPSRHVTLGELAERLGHSDLASRGFYRSGQLTLATGALDEALEYFARAHALSPDDSAGTMLYAEAKLRKGEAEDAVALLDPLSESEKDVSFLALYGEALLRTGRLDRARAVFEVYYKQRPESFAKLFEIAGGYVRAGEDAKAAELLVQTKQVMRAARKEADLVTQMDRMASAHPGSLAVAEVVARLYEELNRETKYFESLMRLFDLYLPAGRLNEACEALDKLVDIDPYDYRNHERIAKLEGKADPAFLQNILARAAKAATGSTRSEGFTGAGSATPSATAQIPEEIRAQQALEDLIVQVEIFLQYSLTSKAIERLERIAELFPGEEDKNERLRALYERANWWPKGTAPKPAPKPAPSAPAAPPPVVIPQVQSAAIDSAVASAVGASTAAETHRDLAAIAEINRLMYRQPTPRDVLNTTAAGVGRHLGVARCLVVVGAENDVLPLMAEYSAPGIAPAGDANIVSIVDLLSKAVPESHCGEEIHVSSAPALKELGIESALGVILSDKETQTSSGAMLVGQAGLRKWKPNESFFLQAVGDQLVLSVNHTRLRSLVRSLAVADEKTGLVSRGAYVDCLLMESNRARLQNTPLSLVMIQIDRGGEILRQHGDTAVDQFIEQLARTLSSSIRQTDVVVKYTAWSLAFILPDTSQDRAHALAEKLRQVAGSVRPSWAGSDLSVSAVVALATARPGDEPEDRVTEWMNRAEAGLDDARQSGGNTLISLATP